MKKETEESRFESLAEKAASGERIFPLYIFHGPRPITTPMCAKLAEALTGGGQASMNVERFSGDTMSEGKVVEFLVTRGLFSTGRKVAWIQDPPFLEGSGSMKARWTRLESSLEKGETEKAMRQMAAILNDKGIGIDEFLVMSPARASSQCDMPETVDFKALLSICRERREEFAKILASSGSGEGRLLEFLQKNRAGETSVILQSEHVDKRCKAFKTLSGLGPIFQLDIMGRGRAREAEAARRVRRWLDEAGAAVEPGVPELVVSLVGDSDLMLLKAETGKLASMHDGEKRIGKRDVRKLVSRSREEELYRLTGAIARRNLGDALESLGIILSQGWPPIVIVSAIGNLIRRMTMLKSAILAGPGTERVKRASSREFEQHILPLLKKYHQAPDQDEKRRGKGPLDGHPYALYMATREIHRFSLEELLDITARMAEFDLAVKGESSSPETYLEYIVFEIVTGRGTKASGAVKPDRRKNT